MEQTQNKKVSFIYIVLLLAVSFVFFSVSVKAFAEENNTIQLEEIMAQSYIFGFKKGETETRGKFILAMLFVPDEVYNANYTYGIIIFPRLYMERCNVYSDYMNGLAEQGKKYLDVVGSVYQPADGGKIFRCGVSNIRDNNMSLVFAFIGYVKDADGNTAYTAPSYADYNTLIARDLSDDEVLGLLEQTRSIRSNFGGIVDKISELVDSVWVYLVIGCAAIVVVWGAYIGIRIAVAKRNEQKLDAKSMVKRLVIGIVIMFVLAGALPLLIKGLSAWI